MEPVEQVAAAATEPAKPISIPRDVLLRLENLNLRMQNVQLQLQIMNQQLGQAITVRDQLQNEMQAVRAQLLKEFGVDIANAKIEADGTVTDPGVKAP